MALLIDHQAISIAVGTRDFGPVTIPDGLTRVTLRLARKTTAAPTLWATGVAIQLDSECSVDGGVTWVQWLGFGASGGIYVKGDGSEATESNVASALPSGTNRTMKLSLTVTGGTLSSLLTVEVE